MVYSVSSVLEDNKFIIFISYNNHNYYYYEYNI